jgi:hypothetical protein
MEPWKRVTTGDPLIEELQDNAEPIMKRVEGAFLLDGVLIKNQTIGTAPVVINHGLQRAPLGFIIVRRRANQQVWDLQDENKTSPQTLVLIAGGDVEIDLWVF